ncbi:hypothetical protein J3T78_04785 [Staphylococcus nepalensis]|uniref:DUF1108 family protein n=1 Tax=Staphylococcus nepalensis TaxID=214473 RepID=A0ABS3L1P4_9STAP|nr:hypothetical protein [Staphylococcus nepalensis]MBO1213756.1 hypothetical protein [Staphylococcus nepalensis]MBO1215022.1 hypothetical protein [Staphylococcus nepalensis]MBO1226978.1 hypothetical protein [Staphylococcus nepalensis]MBO1234092.1 hypothetical protein [Staphylococcus nepalensis]MBO1237024.1 hypothetical protein [Staphylococcus nepalensis]
MERFEINESFVAKQGTVYFNVTKFNGKEKRDSILISSHGYQQQFEFDDTEHNDIDAFIEEVLQDLVENEDFIKLVQNNFLV